MKKNVGKLDMVIRLLIALIIAVLGIINNSWLGLIAIIPLLTGIIRICPLYYPFKISTIVDKNNQE